MLPYRLNLHRPGVARIGYGYNWQKSNTSILFENRRKIMPKGTKSITESVKRVQALKEQMRLIVEQIAAEKAQANAQAQAGRPS